MRRNHLRSLLTFALCLSALAVLGCRDGVGPVGFDSSGFGALDGGSDAGCLPGVTAAAPNSDHTHFPLGTPISYPSNPPAGGPHWPVWARWGVHQDPVPREYLVHNEEHGAIILFYNLALCADGCPALVASLRAFLDAQPQDPVCTTDGLRTRMVLTPDPALDVVWAAAAWGFTYKATSACVLTAPLQAFKDAHYDKGQEEECAQGQF